jgi:chemotaxis protein methyltransferase CheR
MPEGAWLFLGFSESLWQVTDRFQLIRIGDSFVYRRRSATAEVVVAAKVSASRRNRPGRTGPVIGAVPKVRRPMPAKAGGRPRPGVDGRAGVARVEHSTSELMAIGATAVNAMNYPDAIVAFRQCVYLDPDQPAAHLQLGLALEASGAVDASRQAYSAARKALEHGDTSAIEEALEGFGLGELVRLLEQKLAPRAHPGR